MTWLSISLKNAAACDKWYQLQNHFITESLNANGAWEKPFVGHPRACHTQCRTKQKKRKEKKKRKKNLLFFAPSLLSFFKQESELRRGQRRTPVKKGCGAWRGRLAWCLLCGREEGVWKSFAAFPLRFLFPFFSSREAGAAKQNFLKKKHCVFLFN